MLFENRNLTPAEVIHIAVKSAREWSLAQPAASSSTTPASLPTTASISAVRRENVTIFADAAWRPTDGATGCGWILQDATLSVI